jgi:hypothetical protein
MRFKWMTQWLVEMDLVHVVAAVFCDGEIPRVRQLMHDAVYGSLSNTYELSNFSKPHIGLLSNADEHVGMVGKEGPVGPVFAINKWHEKHDMEIMY